MFFLYTHIPIRRSEHITDAFISLHWLRVQEQIVFKVAVWTYRALRGTAPPYLMSQFTHVTDVSTRHSLRLASTDQLAMPSYRLSTVGARAFTLQLSKQKNVILAFTFKTIRTSDSFLMSDYALVINFCIIIIIRCDLCTITDCV